MKALIIIDVQNDFLPGGSLEVPGSAPIVEAINKLLPSFNLVVATQDWHPSNHVSFATNHPNKRPFEKIQLGDIEQILWPPHCVQGTHGAEFSSDLQTNRIETIFRKGTDPQIDSYSGFFDNAYKKSTGLSGYLKEKGANELYFCGLAADICVYYSLRDALKAGFQCHLISDATFPIDQKNYDKVLSELREHGVTIGPMQTSQET